MGHERLGVLLSWISYAGCRFVHGQMGDGLFLQARSAIATGADIWSGRKWYVSPHATNAEVVQTALLAVLAVEEHEARERFLYLGKAIFHPHHSLEALLVAADSSETRSEMEAKHG